MRNTRARPILLTILAVVVAIVLLTIGTLYAFTDFIVDRLWFKSLGYGDYHWYRVLYRYLTLAIFTLFFFIIFFFNFWIGAKFLGAKLPAKPGEDGDRPKRAVYRHFQRRSLRIYMPLSLALAIGVSLPLFFYWESALLYLVAPDTGVADPLYGKDVAYWLFSLPVYLLVFQELLIALVIVLGGLLLLYRRESRAMPRADGHLRRGAKVHLNLVTLLIFLAGAWYFSLQADMLLYTDDHMPIFFGPGYVEGHLELPLIWASALFLLLTAGAFIYFINTTKGLRIFAGCLVTFLAVVGLRYFTPLENLFQDFIVTPNEMTREAPYIANNIHATLESFAVDEIELREYPVREVPWDMTTPEVSMSLQNIPIWDEDGLLKVYRELQELRTYYTFDSVDVDRYSIADVYQQVFLAAREIDIDRLPAGGESWVNSWLKYTHGYGVVMTPASSAGAGPLNWIIQGLPPHSEFDISIDEPAIYYGVGDYRPVIAPNDSRELDYAADGEVYQTDYRGSGGVPVNNLFSKLLFSTYFGEYNIFKTTQTNVNSRILFRRNIVDRIRKLTPYLLLDPNPYPVVTEERIYWIQDAYTYSSWYPYSRPYDGQFRYFAPEFNYIRNSVKIIVDAYDGSVDYYVAEPDDPIVNAYTLLYPGLFKDFDKMPLAVREHVRYPKPLFDIQMDVYARYHQTDPEVFYKSEDVWEFPQVWWRDDLRTISSYYLTLNLVDRDVFEFSLFVPMTPKGQRNMRTLAVVGSDGANYGRIVTYRFPKGTLVYGPSQIDALVKQDPEITARFTLWNQEGSTADRGRMVIVPVDGVVTYIQGVFLEATAAPEIPELARLIVSQGRLVVMAESLEDAFRKLNERIREVREEPPEQAVPPPALPPVVTPDDGPN